MTKKKKTTSILRLGASGPSNYVFDTSWLSNYETYLSGNSVQLSSLSLKPISCLLRRKVLSLMLSRRAMLAQEKCSSRKNSTCSSSTTMIGLPALDVGQAKEVDTDPVSQAFSSYCVKTRKIPRTCVKTASIITLKSRRTASSVFRT